MTVRKSPRDFLPRFGLEEFRSGQEDVIQSVIDGKDVLCVMPTGGGKSLCYQLPSLVLEGLTIVVSPLIALMKDQVDALQQKGFRAALINSSLSPAEQHDRMIAMSEGQYDLVYIAPERLRNRRFLDCIRQTKIALLAIDEAHCISEWGHDFRPDYARLGQFRTRHLGGVQTIALTATATPVVREDIVKLLSLHEPNLFVTGFSRDNLHFAVQQCGGDRDKDERLAKFVASQTGCGIIYAATRKRCEEVAAWLPERLGKPVGIYHGGLEPQQRRQIQEDFMGGKLGAIVATNAFGMGIDKSDIRYVIHYNMPGSLEAYYQEAGRAGRDGKPSECLLLFSYADRYVQEFFIENNYPTKEIVQKIYAFLQSRKEDPIELTLDQIKEHTQLSIGSEAIGTAERLLSKTGVLERLDSSVNQAVLRIDGEHPTLVDMIPRDAKVKRRVLQAAEKIVGRRRGEDVFFPLDRIINLSEQTASAVKRSLRDLRKLKNFDYIPPFRGRAIHFRETNIPFHKLEIDFAELDRRKRAEYEKLDHVIRFAQTPRCRQLAVLNYFGDPDAQDCNNCDRCVVNNPGLAIKKAMVSGDAIKAPSYSDEEREVLTKAVRIVLSGLARTHGRFGKGIVAQMLAGSQNKKVQQLKLDRLSTYGLLKGLKQAQVGELLDSVCNVGLAEQLEVTQRRPTLKLTGLGEEVMKGTMPLPNAFTLPKALKMRAMACVRSNVAQEESSSEETQSIPESAADSEFVQTLRHWRRDAANELGVPAYRIFSNTTLQKIASTEPQSVTELEAVDGVGNETIEQFGTAIVELVLTKGKTEASGFSAAHSTQTPEPEAPSEDEDYGADSAYESASDITNETPEAEQTIADEFDPEDQGTIKAVEVDSDEYWSWKLLNDGYSADECCQIRRIDRGELISHLVSAVQQKRPIQLNWVAGENAELLEKVAKASATNPNISELMPNHLDPRLLELARESVLQSKRG